MKKLKLLLFMLIISLLFVGCGSDKPNPEKKQMEESNEAVEEDQNVEIIESGYSVDGDYLNFGFVIENKSKNIAFDFPKIIITAYDDSGSVLATEDQVLNSIEPGEIQAFSSIMNCNGQVPSNVEFTVEAEKKKQPSDNAIQSSGFEIIDANEREGNLGTAVTGMIKNNSNKDTNSVAITALYKKDGQIVFGEVTFVDNLKSGSEKPFELSLFGNVPDHDSFEVFAIDWGF